MTICSLGSPMDTGKAYRAVSGSYRWQVILLILLVGEVWFLQFVPADGSFGSSPSTVGLVTSLSNVVNAWSGIKTSECIWFEVIEALSLLGLILTRPFPAQWTSLFQVEVKSYCLPTEYCYDQVRAQSRRYYQRTKNLVHPTPLWRYPDFLYGQRFEVNQCAVALLTILVMRLDAQTEFFCFDIRNSAVEPRYDNQVWCKRCYCASNMAWYKIASIFHILHFSDFHYCKLTSTCGKVI